MLQLNCNDYTYFMKKAPYSIIYEDDQLIVVYKERDVFSIRTTDKRTYSHNLYHYIYEYLKKSGEKPFIVHRLDYETSGLLVFAKNAKLKEILQKQFEERKVVRKYEAVIKEIIPPNERYDVKQHLTSNGKGGKVYVSNELEGKDAITHLVSRNKIQIGTVLDISIETGRRAQIRMAISSLGYHLLGDIKYSSTPAKRMYLNAYELIFPDDTLIKEKRFFVKPLWLIQ